MIIVRFYLVSAEPTGVSYGEISGIVIGTVAVIITITALIVIILKKRKGIIDEEIFSFTNTIYRSSISDNDDKVEQ